MAPVIIDNSFLLIQHQARLRPNHIVFVEHPKFGDIVKRINHIHANGHLTLSGDHWCSVSSDQMGLCKPQWVIGRVRLIVKPGD